MDERITLNHGSGGHKTSELIADIFKKNLDNEYFTADDAAVMPAPEGRIVMSTDGFIVSPWEFPGGNIGKLSVCGTVNDIACMGARPLYLTCSYVIEEGFAVADLVRIAEAMGETARKAGVKIVAGDTKVAGKGQVDGLFITTAGVGVIENDVSLSGSNAKPGDSIIVTGDVGRHGCAILLARDEYGIEADVTSDCAPLADAALALIKSVPETHVIRDSTRGGVGTVLYEICDQSNVGIEIVSDSVPVDPAVKGVTGLLGLEPLYLACEGRFVVIVPSEFEEKALETLRSVESTKDSVVIGKVVEDHQGKVVMKTPVGGMTFLPPPGKELLPRIC